MGHFVSSSREREKRERRERRGDEREGQGDVIYRRSKPVTKGLQKVSKGHNSANIWCTVTLKQYTLLHIRVNKSQ